MRNVRLAYAEVGSISHPLWKPCKPEGLVTDAQVYEKAAYDAFASRKELQMFHLLLFMHEKPRNKTRAVHTSIRFL